MFDLLAQAGNFSAGPLAEYALVVASGIYAVDRVFDRFGVGKRNGANGCRWHTPPCAELQVLDTRFAGLERKVDHMCDSVDRLRSEIQDWRVEVATKHGGSP